MRKINKTLSPLYPIAQHLPRPILDQIYKMYVRPHFDYCDAIYDGLITIQDATRLRTLQNRAGRLVTGGLFRTATDKLHTELGWDRLTTRRQMHRLTLFHRLKNPAQHTPNYITALITHTRGHDTNRTLRNAGTLTTTIAHTSLYQKSFFQTTSRQWNELSDTTRQLTQKPFKKHLREQLGLPDPPPFSSMGSKIGNVLHSRLRMDMTHLNSHLFIVQKVDSPACQCGHQNENVPHFVLSCPNFTDLRNVLYERISLAININLRTLSRSAQLDILLHGANLGGLDGSAVAHHFQNYVLNSRRFKVS